MDVVVVGGGLAGIRCAEALRQAGLKGSITLVGEEAHLPYERPPLSKGVLLGTQAAQAVTVLDRHLLERAAIKLHLGVRAVEIDRPAKTVGLSNSESLRYDKLVLATGIRPRRLERYDVPGRLFFLRTLDDALALKTALRPRARILIVGAGYLGLECAASARQLDCEVTVIERSPSVLFKAAAPIVGNYVADLHVRNGVSLHTGCQVAKFRLVEEGTGHAMHVALSTGTELKVDLVIAAVGSIPNAELAEAAGLEVRDGIIVDEFGRTSDPDIYAVGDVARHYNPLLKREIRLESWQHAQRQAVAIAKVIAGGKEPYSEVPWFWTDQYNLNLQIVGFPESWDDVLIRGTPPSGKFTALYVESGRVVAANMINNGRDTQWARQLVAGQIKVDVAMANDPQVPLQQLVKGTVAA